MDDLSRIRIALAAKKYRLDREIGFGSFSVVYSCFSEMDNNKYAVKVFPKSNLKCKEDEGRFQREIDTMAYLRYDNIVAMYDFFWDDANFYMIIDYCEGGELFDYIIRNKRLEEPISALIFKQIVGAVAFCHSYGVAHRDLKPENILICDFPTVKVSDFGLCGFVNEEKLMKSFCGSPSYCAPECLCKIQYDGRLADIWSLGVILYAMVTGEHPWDVSNTSVMLKQIMKCNFKCPSYLTPACKDLITSMLRLKPSDRIPIQKILEHPWMQYSEWALVDPPPNLGLSLSQLRLQAPMSLEQISSSSSRSSHMSEHGIICPFDSDSDISDILGFEEPLSLSQIRQPSLPNLRIQHSGLETITSASGKEQRRIIPLSSRQKKRGSLVIPHVNHMSAIKEIE